MSGIAISGNEEAVSVKLKSVSKLWEINEWDDGSARESSAETLVS